MTASLVKNIRSYAASIFTLPVNHVDNEYYTVCWNCFVRNYKPHNGQCNNCGITLWKFRYVLSNELLLIVEGSWKLSADCFYGLTALACELACGFHNFRYRLGTDINRREFQRHCSTLLVHSCYIESKLLWVSCSQTAFPRPRLVGVTAIIPKVTQFLRPSSQLLEYIKPQAFTRDYEVIIGKAIGQAKRKWQLACENPWQISDRMGIPQINKTAQQ